MVFQVLLYDPNSCFKKSCNLSMLHAALRKPILYSGFKQKCWLFRFHTCIIGKRTLATLIHDDDDDDDD